MSYNTLSLPEILEDMNRKIEDNNSNGAIQEDAAAVQDLNITGLTVQAQYYNEPLTGIARSRMIADWNDQAPLSTEFLIRDEFSHYLVRLNLDTTTNTAWTETATSSLTIEDLPLSMDATFEVKAVSRGGREGTISSQAFNTSKDTTPPPQPSTPTLLPGIKSIRVAWNGRDVGNAVMPIDLTHVEVHSSLSGATFTPSATTLTDTIPAGGGTVIIQGDDNYSTTYVRLVGVDSSKNKSVTSTAANAKPLQVVATDAGFALPGDIAFSDVDNMLIDGSFESSYVRAARTSIIGNVIFENTAGMAASGSWYLKFTGDATPTKEIILNGYGSLVRTPIAGDGKLYVNARIRGISANGNCRVTLQFYNQAGTVTAVDAISTTSSTGNWITAETVVQIPAGSISVVVLVQTVTHTTGTWYVDAIQVKNVIPSMLIADAAITNAKIAALAVKDANIESLNGNKIIANTILTEHLGVGVISTNLLKDPGAEEVYAFGARGESGWIIASETSSITKNKNAAYSRSGDYCFDFLIPASGAITLDSSVFVPKAGSTYKCIVYGVASTANVAMHLKIYNFNGTSWTETNGNSVTLPAKSSTPRSLDYTKLSAEFIIPAGTTKSRVRIIFSNGGTGASVAKFDDVSAVLVNGSGASELSAAGLRLFNSIGEEAVTLLTGRPNTFTVNDANGNVLAEIREDGTATFKDLVVNEEPRFQGKDLSEYFYPLAKGLKAYSRYVGDHTIICNNRTGLATFTWYKEPHRLYELRFTWPVVYASSSGAHTAYGGMRMTTSAAYPPVTPTLTQPESAGVQIMSIQGSTFYTPETFIYRFVPVSSGEWVTVLMSLERSGGVGDVQAWFRPWATTTEFAIYDVGPSSIPETAWNWFANPIPPTYFRTTRYSVTSAQSYSGGGSGGSYGTIRTDTTNLFQGYYSGVWGNQFSRATLNTYYDGSATDASTVPLALSGATDISANLTFTVLHTYQGSGGTLYIYRDDGQLAWSGPVTAGSTYTVPIGANALPTTSLYRYGFGQAPNTSQSYYMYCSPTMYLTITYKK